MDNYTHQKDPHILLKILVSSIIFPLGIVLVIVVLLLALGISLFEELKKIIKGDGKKRGGHKI